MTKVFHKLAKVFNGLHWLIGITTLPEDASAHDERMFVLMWLGIIIFTVVFLGLFFYWLV